MTKKQVILPIAAFAIFSTLIFSGNSFGSGKFPIRWFPDKIEQSQFIGTSQIINATFKSTEDLENVKFWLTPRLSKYAKVEPETLPEIKKNQEYNILIITSIPTDFKTRKETKDDFKNSLKNYLNQDFDEKEYNNDFKENEDFFKDFSLNKIQGLLFVAEEKQSFWPNFIKQKRTVRKIYPLPLKIIVNVKKATGQDILEPFETDSDPTKVVVSDGVRFIVNEIVILLEEEVKLSDAIRIAGLVNGVITGFVPDPPTYKIEVPAVIPEELNTAINKIKNSYDQLIVEIIPNVVSY